MDLRFLKKQPDNLTDFDSESGFVETRPMNSSSITIHNYPQNKKEIQSRKSELFTRKPHFLPTIIDYTKGNSKERTKSVDKVGENFFLNQKGNQSDEEWDINQITKEYSRQTTNRTSSIISRRITYIIPKAYLTYSLYIY